MATLRQRYLQSQRCQAVWLSSEIYQHLLESTVVAIPFRAGLWSYTKNPELCALSSDLTNGRYRRIPRGFYVVPPVAFFLPRQLPFQIIFDLAPKWYISPNHRGAIVSQSLRSMAHVSRILSEVSNSLSSWNQVAWTVSR